jgi:hypothetical protein
VLSLATALVLTLCSAAQRIHTSPSGGSKSNEGEIRQLVASYAKYIDNADVSLASQIWLDSPDVSFIHPLGHEHGFEQIKQNVYEHLMGDTFASAS